MFGFAHASRYERGSVRPASGRHFLGVRLTPARVTGQPDRMGLAPGGTSSLVISALVTVGGFLSGLSALLYVLARLERPRNPAPYSSPGDLRGHEGRLTDAGAR
jgi:hypothetical protein